MTRFIFVAQLRSNEGSTDAAELMIVKTAECKGERLLKLFDPKGEYKWTGCWSDGAEQWTPESMQILDHRFGHDGVFWMSYKDLLRSSKLITRVRLLDSDWKVARPTAAVEVPWIKGYLTDKFRFTLEKHGSVIIVLSQLDRRYFNGLDDNYKFRLKFRPSQPDTEDLSVESRPSHRHERSVAIEIDLEAGTYDVDISITALKNPNARPLTDIVRENIGYKRSALFAAAFSHDLAHTKAYGWSDLQEKRWQAERRRGATRLASTKDYNDDVYSGHSSHVASLGEEAEGWDPVCAVCLRVYVRNENGVDLRFVREKSEEAGGSGAGKKLADFDVGCGADLEGSPPAQG